MRSLRDRFLVVGAFTILFIFLTSFYWGSGRADGSTHILEEIHDKVLGPTTTEPYPKYKPTQAARSLPIVDNFPHALAAHSAADLPPIATWNQPPNPHVAEKTPLFIGFTRNWRLLQQVVVSYITSGWPPEDIYVIENTGVMDSNAKELLSLQNPFFLNHTRLHMLGVNVIVAPTLLTFAQLQNFYLFHSISQNWTTYFWSHMDVVSVSFEDQYHAAKTAESKAILPSSDPRHDYSDYESVYTKCLNALRKAISPDPTTGKVQRWAMRFFSYDRLALVNVASFVEVGGWDTLIPFYMTDCDMHARLEMAKFDITEVPAGLIYDVASSLDDLIVLYRKKGVETPEASFKDPNAIEEELKAIAEAELELGKAGLRGENKEDEEVKKENVRRSEKDEAEKEGDKTAETAWEKAAEGLKVNAEQKSESAKKDATSTSTTSTSASASTTSSAPTVTQQDSTSTTSTPIPTPATASTTPSTSNSKWEEDTIFSPSFETLMRVLDRMQGSKHENSRGRNTWQSRQIGGQGDPFYRDSEGFAQGIEMTIDHGRRVFADKWGHRDCDIVAKGLMPGDAWRVEHDWK